MPDAGPAKDPIVGKIGDVDLVRLGASVDGKTRHMEPRPPGDGIERVLPEIRCTEEVEDLDASPVDIGLAGRARDIIRLQWPEEGAPAARQAPESAARAVIRSVTVLMRLDDVVAAPAGGNDFVVENG